MFSGLKCRLRLPNVEMKDWLIIITVNIVCYPAESICQIKIRNIEECKLLVRSMPSMLLVSFLIPAAVFVGTARSLSDGDEPNAMRRR